MDKNRNTVALSNGAQVKPYSDDPVTTPNYEIPLMDAEETADFMGKWNPAMNIIDQSIGEIQHVGSNVELRVENVEDRTDKLEEDVVSIIDRLGSYASLPGDVETNAKDISDLAEKVVKNFGKLTDSTAYPPEKPVSNGELTASMYLPSGVVASHWGNYGDSFGPMSNRSNGALSKQADDLAQTATNRWGAYSDSYTPETVNTNGALSKKADGLAHDVENVLNLLTDDNLTKLNKLLSFFDDKFYPVNILVDKVGVDYNVRFGELKTIGGGRTTKAYIAIAVIINPDKSPDTYIFSYAEGCDGVVTTGIYSSHNITVRAYSDYFVMTCDSNATTASVTIIPIEY